MTTTNTIGIRPALLTVIVVALTHSVWSQPALTHRPNIITIVMDDMRWDQVDAMPLTRAWLEAGGVRFQHAYVHSPLCCPNRESLYTGQYVHQHGVYSIDGPEGGAKRFNATQHLGVWLQASGYDTGFFGKIGNGLSQLEMPVWPFTFPGWTDQRLLIDESDEQSSYYNYRQIENGNIVQYSNDVADYHTKVVGAQLRGFISNTPKRRPFYAVAAFIAPHMPAMPATRADLTAAQQYPLPQPPSFNEADVRDKHPYVQAIPPFTTDQRDKIAQQWKRQIASLQEADRQIDKIRQTLVTTGRAATTWVFFVSDNGTMEGEHRLSGKKDCAFDGCVRTPFLVLGPQITPRVDSTHLVSTLDIPPTVLALANVTPTLPQMGLNLLPLLANPATPWRQFVLVELLAFNRPRPPFWSVHSLTDVYTEYFDGFREYYHRGRDPYQLVNKVDALTNSSRIQQLRTWGILERSR